jgi:hypothetical protein
MYRMRLKYPKAAQKCTIRHLFKMPGSASLVHIIAAPQKATVLAVQVAYRTGEFHQNLVSR